VRATIQYGWSRDVLVHQIEFGLHRRQGGTVTNFDQVLPPAPSDRYLDLLFYHFKLGPFQPEFTDKMTGSWLSMRCGTFRSRLASEYQLAAALPDTLKGNLRVTRWARPLSRTGR